MAHQIYTTTTIPIKVVYTSGLNLSSRYVREYLQSGWQGNYRNRAWTTTPNWKKVKRQSYEQRMLLKSLGYTDINRKRFHSLVCFSHPTANNGLTLTNQYWGAALFPTATTDSLWMTNLLNSTKQKAASKVGDHTVNLGVAAGEAHKTFSMFAGAVRDLVSAYRDVRRGNFAKAAKTLGIRQPIRAQKGRDFTNNWLEYRYGWRLLVMDLDGAVRHLAQVLMDSPPIYRVKATDKDISESKFSGYVGGSNAQNINLWFDYVMIEESLIETSVVYKYTIPNSELSRLNQLGLTNLQLVVWELVPFSFVVDKMINIGEVLTNMTAFYGKQFVDGCYTVQNTVKRTGYCTKASTGSVHNEFVGYLDGPSWCELTERTFKRVVLTNFSTAVPSVRWNFNNENALDALAILRQVFSKR